MTETFKYKTNRGSVINSPVINDKKVAFFIIIGSHFSLNFNFGSSLKSADIAYVYILITIFL